MSRSRNIAGDGALCLYASEGSSSFASLLINNEMTSSNKDTMNLHLDATAQLEKYIEHFKKVRTNHQDGFECNICGDFPKIEAHYSNGHGGKDDIHFVCSVECQKDLEDVRKEILREYHEIHNQSPKINEDLDFVPTPEQPLPTSIGENVNVLEPRYVTREDRRNLRWWRNKLSRPKSVSRGGLTPEQMNQLGIYVMKERMGLLSNFERQQLLNLRRLRSGGYYPSVPIPLPTPALTGTVPVPEPSFPIVPVVRRPVDFSPAKKQQLFLYARKYGVSRIRFPWQRRGTWLVPFYNRPEYYRDFDQELTQNCLVMQCPPGMPPGTRCWQCFDTEDIPQWNTPYPGTDEISTAPEQPLSPTPLPPIIFQTPTINVSPSVTNSGIPRLTVARNASQIRVSTEVQNRLGPTWFDFINRARPTQETSLLEQVTDITLLGQTPEPRGGLGAGTLNCTPATLPSDFDRNIYKGWKCFNTPFLSPMVSYNPQQRQSIVSLNPQPEPPSATIRFGSNTSNILPSLSFNAGNRVMFTGAGLVNEDDETMDES